MEFKDYYGVLGVEPSAGDAEIKTAYRRLARKYHPDVSKEAGAEEKFKGVNEAYAIQAGREVRVMVDAKRVGDDEAYFIAKKIADRVSAEMTFPGEIKVTVLRETRAIEVAR